MFTSVTHEIEKMHTNMVHVWNIHWNMLKALDYLDIPSEVDQSSEHDLNTDDRQLNPAVDRLTHDERMTFSLYIPNACANVTNLNISCSKSFKFLKSSKPAGTRLLNISKHSSFTGFSRGQVTHMTFCNTFVSQWGNTETVHLATEMKWSELKHIKTCFHKMFGWISDFLSFTFFGVMHMSS